MPLATNAFPEDIKVTEVERSAQTAHQANTNQTLVRKNALNAQSIRLQTRLARHHAHHVPLAQQRVKLAVLSATTAFQEHTEKTVNLARSVGNEQRAKM